MLRNMKLGVDETVSPRLDVFGKECNAIGDLMFSNQKIRSMDPDRKAEVLLPYEEGPRAIAFKKKERRMRRSLVICSHRWQYIVSGILPPL